MFACVFRIYHPLNTLRASQRILTFPGKVGESRKAWCCFISTLHYLIQNKRGSKGGDGQGSR